MFEEVPLSSSQHTHGGDCTLYRTLTRRTVIRASLTSWHVSFYSGGTGSYTSRSSGVLCNVKDSLYTIYRYLVEINESQLFAITFPIMCVS